MRTSMMTASGWTSPHTWIASSALAGFPRPLQVVLHLQHELHRRTELGVVIDDHDPHCHHHSLRRCRWSWAGVHRPRDPARTLDR
jgi:hypothetical protein